MDTVELHRDILQPGGQLETPGLGILPIVSNIFKVIMTVFRR